MKSILVALAITASIVVSATPAYAAPGDGSAFGVLVTAAPVNPPPFNFLGPIAPSNTNGPTSNSAVSASLPGSISTGAISTTAVRNETTGSVTSTASVASVFLPVLGIFGTITLGAINVTCDATQAGNTGSTTLTNANLGTIGSVPVTPTPNTRISFFPIFLSYDSIVFNEQKTNPDGSLTVIGVYLHASFHGAPDIIISSATCGPAALPIPLASGMGLWIVLGILGVVGIPTAVRFARQNVKKRLEAEWF